MKSIKVAVLNNSGDPTTRQKMTGAPVVLSCHEKNAGDARTPIFAIEVYKDPWCSRWQTDIRSQFEDMKYEVSEESSALFALTRPSRVS